METIPSMEMTVRIRFTATKVMTLYMEVMAMTNFEAAMATTP